MKKTFLLQISVVCLLLSASPMRVGAAVSYSSTASFGNGATCAGSGICSSCTDAGMSVIYSYDKALNVLTISFLASDLQTAQPDKLKDFMAASYRFDSDWAAPDVLNRALGTTIVVKKGISYPLTTAKNMCTITIPLTQS